MVWYVLFNSPSYFFSWLFAIVGSFICLVKVGGSINVDGYLVTLCHGSMITGSINLNNIISAEVLHNKLIVSTSDNATYTFHEAKYSEADWELILVTLVPGRFVEKPPNSENEIYQILPEKKPKTLLAALLSSIMFLGLYLYGLVFREVPIITSRIDTNYYNEADHPVMYYLMMVIYIVVFARSLKFLNEHIQKLRGNA
jgi:hypothetical protein